MALGLHWRAVQEIDLVATVSVSSSAASRHELQDVPVLLQREQLAATDFSTAAWKSVVRSLLISPSMSAHPGNLAFRYRARYVAARRAFPLHPQKQGKMTSCHSSKDCPRTSILDHALQRQILAFGHAEAQKHVSHLARKQLLARTHTKCRVVQSHAARARSSCAVEIKVQVMLRSGLLVPCTHPARDLHVSRMQPLLGKDHFLHKNQQKPSASMRSRLISGSFATQVHVCLF